MAFWIYFIPIKYLLTHIEAKIVNFFPTSFTKFFSVIRRFALCGRNIYFELISKLFYQLVEKKC